MKAINKDIFYEIKNTKSKFLSLVVIIFLGVFVFVGLEETPPTINKTLNNYLKESNVYDLKISNDLYLTQEDLEDISKLESIEDSEIYYYSIVKDVKTNYDIELQSLSEKIATPKIVEGKNITENNEILLSESLRTKYKLNDYIELKEKNNTQENGIKLTTFKYKIVGFVYGIDYPENSTNNKANTNYFAYTKKENFETSVVSGINIILKDIPKKNYTDNTYYENVNSQRDKIVDFLAKNQERHNQKLKEDSKKIWKNSWENLQSLKKQINDKEENLIKLKNLLADDVFLKVKEEIEKNKQLLDAKEEELSIAKEKIEAINYPKFNVENVKGNKQYSQLIESAKSLKSISAIFSVFLFGVAILVSLTTITRMIDENRTNIGTLKSLGYNNLTISKKYYVYGLLSSLFGGIIGIIGAYNIIVPVIYSSYARFLTLNVPEISISIETIVISLLIAITCMTLAVYIPLKKILLDKSAYLLRPKSPKSGSRIILENFKFIWKRLSFLYKVTFRNIFRYKIRMLMTIFGVLGCLALMFVGFGIRYSVANIVEKQFGEITKYDIIATYNPYINNEEKKQLENTIKNFDVNYKKINVNRATIEKNNEILDYITLFTLDNNIDDYFTLKDENNNFLTLSDNGVLISEKLAHLYNLNTGSKIKITLNEKQYELLVNGIVKNHFGHLIYMNKDYYTKNIEEKYQENSYLIKAEHNIEKTKNIMEKLEENTNIITAQNNLKFKESSKEFISGIDIIVIVIVLCSLSLALVVLYNLININVSERIRELSTIKVLGFYTKEVTMYIFREILYLGIIGIVLGNYFGYKLYKKIILDLAAREMMFDKSASIMVYILCSSVTLFIIFVVMIIMHIKLKKVNMVESLKSVE